ncbi:MAG: hypothetical protein GY928_33870 [Colwellia sp.]|nr:hypothetical protein [Colwellia sp.]
MTCIVGLEHNGKVTIGGDSASSISSELFTDTTRVEKVFKRDEFLFGCAGSVVINQTIRYRLVVKKQGKKQSDMEYMCVTFVDSLRELLKSLNINQGGVTEGFEALVGYKGKLYCIYHDFQINSTIRGFDSVGNGNKVAIGSMQTSKGRPPKKRIKKALKVAANYCMGVSKPYKILTI